MRVLLLLFCLLISAPLHATANNGGGHLVIIGGALAPDNADIYTEIIRLGGGTKNCRIVILAAASATPTTSGDAYGDDFLSFGVPSERVELLPLALLDDPQTQPLNESTWAKNHDDPATIARIDQASVAFLAGGDQGRYTRLLTFRHGKDTLLLQALRRLLQRGGVIAGTSAGAAVMSDPMITGGDSLDSLIPAHRPGSGNPVTLDRGLGFWQGGLVDQHFIRRGRWGRLLAALERSPNHTIGLGVSENTAAFIHGNNLSAMGAGAVVLIDKKKSVRISQSPLHMKGFRLYYLQHGDKIDLRTLQLTSAKQRALVSNPVAESPPPQRTPMAGAFDPYGLMRLLEEHLAGFRRRQVQALAWDGCDNSSGPGIELTVRIIDSTRVFHQQQSGKDTWTFQEISLDIIPITVNVHPRQNEKVKEK